MPAAIGTPDTLWVAALIVLVASVMIPLGKLAALVYLLVTVQRGSIESNQDRTKLYRLVEFIGRWSMLDVFVVAYTVALVQLEPLTTGPCGCHLSTQVVHQSRQVGRRRAAQVCTAAAAARGVTCTRRSQHFPASARHDLLLELPARWEAGRMGRQEEGG